DSQDSGGLWCPSCLVEPRRFFVCEVDSLKAKGDGEMAKKIRMAALVCCLVPAAITASAQGLTPVEEGRRVFLSHNCYGCHGVRAGGTSFGAPQFRSDKAELGDLTEAVREGEDRGMPAFP